MEGRNTSLDDFWRKTQRQIVTRPRLSISVFVSSWSQDLDEKKYPTVNLSFFIEGQKTHEASFTKQGKLARKRNSCQWVWKYLRVIY